MYRSRAVADPGRRQQQARLPTGGAGAPRGPRSRSFGWPAFQSPPGDGSSNSLTTMSTIAFRMSSLFVDVVVQRHRLDAELLREPAHRERLDPVRRPRGRSAASQHPLPAQRDSRLGDRDLPAMPSASSLLRRGALGLDNLTAYDYLTAYDQHSTRPWRRHDRPHAGSGDTMKAMVYRRYGSPDVLHLEDVEMPDRRRRPGARPGRGRVGESAGLALPAGHPVLRSAHDRAAHAEAQHPGRRCRGRASRRSAGT